ncbi:MAG: putative selenate ABC transporter substrate-binding protein [Planctomycetota bacterium]|jgi:phosphonate transport system substrate-binding protein|nr:putative selenate ABC transporter substrate-binding protein [Planctomycetota bacterium]
MIPIRIPLLLLAGLLAACSVGTSEKTLYFSAIPDQNTTELREKFGRIADYLSKELGIPVTYRPARDYGASVEMFRNGDIQLAWFGGLTGVQARQAVPGARAIAQGKADPKYYSYFIAHKDTGLERSDAFPTRIADVKFAFGSESSTSGRLMPEFFIRRNSGKGPKEFFDQQYIFSRSHDQTAELVESGQVQAGVLNHKVYERRIESGKTDPTVCKIIWKTPFYADYNFTAHPDLETMFGAGFIEKLQNALIDMTDMELLSAFPRDALILAKNEDFDGIVRVARELDMLR